MKKTSLLILLLYVLEIPIKFYLKKKKNPSAALAILLAVANLEVTCWGEIQ